MKMTHYSLETIDQIFAKSYGFFSFAKDRSENIRKNISKSLSSKSVSNVLIMPNNLLQMPLKLLQREQLKKSRSNCRFDW